LELLAARVALWDESTNIFIGILKIAHSKDLPETDERAGRRGSDCADLPLGSRWSGAIKQAGNKG
jgi:hypothetical protein